METQLFFFDLQLKKLCITGNQKKTAHEHGTYTQQIGIRQLKHTKHNKNSHDTELNNELADKRA